MRTDIRTTTIDPAIAEWNAGLPATTTSYEPPASLRNIRQLMDTASSCIGALGGLSVMLGFIAAMTSTVSLRIDPGWGLALGGLVTTLVYFCLVLLCNKETRDEDESMRLHKARMTLAALAGKEHVSHPQIGYLLHAIDQDRAPGSSGAAMLIAVDPVLRRYDVLTSRIGHDADAMIKAREHAMNSISRIVADIRVRSAGPDETAMLSSFEDDCLALADGRDPTNPTRMLVPSARIARIIDTAERALLAHPDLTDASGARIDDLVRRHVPRLLEIHAVAAGTATAEETAGVDATLDEGIEMVRRSVEEGLSRLHDDAMQALSTELRFLALRRGSTPLLTAVA
jgi:hypothetical protein